MKHLSSTSRLLSALVLLCGCGGGGSPSASSGPTAQGKDVAGNWQFSTTSADAIPSTTIAGSIAQTGTSVSGAVHLDGSNCFDHLTTVHLTGTLTGKDLTLTSEPVDGQVATFTGTISDDPLNGAYSAFTGTYAINGGCADRDHGGVTGIRIPVIANNLTGTFTASGGDTFDMTGDWAQYGTSSTEGSFGISGKVTFHSSCFKSGTIKPGTLPSASFIIGMTVALEIDTDNGIVSFLGTLNRDRSDISGHFTASGATCDETGAAVIHITSPWDY